MEQGDPRGELIRAQLADESPVIDDASARCWVGNIGELIRWGEGVRFERGFLSGCTVDALDGKAAAAPEWTTIEVLDVKGSIAEIGRYPLRSLRAVGGLHSRDVTTLLRSPVAPELQAVGLRRVLKADRSRTWDLLCELPRLRFLAVGAFAFDPSLADHPLLEKIELLSYPARELVTPSAPWSRTRIAGFRVKQRCTNSDGVWLPNYNKLARRGS